MKGAYITALVIGGFGLLLLISYGAGSAPVTLAGIQIPSQVVKGVGIIACIFSLIAFLAAYGSSLQAADTRAGREQGRSV